MRTALLALFAFALATTAHAQPASKPKPRAVFEADVARIGPASNFLCGIAMATQRVHVRVTKAVSGTPRAGDPVAVSVLTCFGGPLLVPIDPDTGTFQLDPQQIRPGSRIRVDVEEIAPRAWFTTTDKVFVLKR